VYEVLKERSFKSFKFFIR